MANRVSVEVHVEADESIPTSKVADAVQMMLDDLVQAEGYDDVTVAESSTESPSFQEDSYSSESVGDELREALSRITDDDMLRAKQIGLEVTFDE
jgi:hypothetical protein